MPISNNVLISDEDLDEAIRHLQEIQAHIEAGDFDKVCGKALGELPWKIFTYAAIGQTSSTARFNAYRFLVEDEDSTKYKLLSLICMLNHIEELPTVSMRKEICEFVMKHTDNNNKTGTRAAEILSALNTCADIPKGRLPYTLARQPKP